MNSLIRLWIFYQNTYQSILVEQGRKEPITIGTSLTDTLTISSVKEVEDTILVLVEENAARIKIDNELEININLNQEQQVSLGDHSLKMMITKEFAFERTFYIGHKGECLFTIAPQNGDLVKGINSLSDNEEFTLYKQHTEWKIKGLKTRLYVNGHQQKERSVIKKGDTILWDFMQITLIAEDTIQVKYLEKFECSLPIIEMPQSEMQKRYPIYRRTPRMIYDLPDDKVQLAFPSQEVEDSRRGLWLIILPPLTMLIAMTFITIFVPRGIFIVVSIVMFLTTLLTSTAQYIKDRKRHKQNEQRRRRIYKQYLVTKREELEQLALKQQKVLEFHFPSFERMKYLTSHISDRIWERTIESDDFLQFRLGRGTVPASFSMTNNNTDMSKREMDDLLEESQKLESTYRSLKNLPITVNLSEGAIGLIGKRSVLKKELHQLIGQLAFQHSYHDVRFIFIFNEDEYGEWEWMKWLPHFQFPQSFAKGFIYNERTRDQLLTFIYEMIRERDLAEDKEKLKFLPHLIFFITDQQLISEHVIMQYLEGEYSHLGISVVFVAEVKESFSDNIHTLVRYINDEEGDILIQQKKAVQISFRLDEHTQKNNEAFARMLRTLDHQVGMTNSIPDSVSFLEMLQVKDIEDLPISQNWLTMESAKSLAVPVGLKGKNDLVDLNLHEKAHGPHGLLAGTTGSGKSEFLQTYILSLAVHFHPHEVSFLLIDYKGGGMAQPFKGIPHLLGTITNIEGSKNFSMRALASIKSELKRRQRLFDEYQVTHINQYTRMYKEGKTTDPLPHLFIISDEFAELKSEEPEFIQELVSAARIGRSLGVHLILATQKPGGVINDQILSNARFRVALKVQNVEDSREILKNGDAAGITITGRGYLQVGNNEVYELFQSAWSGAPYQEDTTISEDEVAIVTDLGLIPLSDLATEQNVINTVKTEIELIVDKIESTQKKLGIKKLRSPWLEPLANRLYKYSNHHAKEKSPRVLVAMTDEPDKQIQSPYYYELIEDGNIGLIGSSGYGKTQTLITLLMGMAHEYSPEEIHYFLLDFGNGGLLPLKQLPHTAEYFIMDEDRKLEKLVGRLREEMANRKVLFQELEVSSIKMYNHLSENKLPLLFITIDNFDVVKEEMLDFETTVQQIARDGQSLGIYIILSATRLNSIRQSLLNTLRTKIVHYLIDHNEAFSIVGRVPFIPEPIPGRVLIKKDETYLSQVYLSNEGKDDYEQLRLLKEEVQHLQDKYSDLDEPVGIPMLPTELNYKQFVTYLKKSQTGVTPIGLNEETVQPVCVDFKQHKHCVIVGQSQKGKTNIVKVLLHNTIDQGVQQLAIFDSIDQGLIDYRDKEQVVYLTTNDSIKNWLDSLDDILHERAREQQLMLEQGINTVQYESIYLFIDGYARFLQTIDKKTQDQLVRYMTSFGHLGFHIVVAGSNNDLSRGFEPLTAEVKQIQQGIVLMKKTDQTLFNLPYVRKETEIQPGFGYYVSNGKDTKIQIPLMLTERKVHT